MRRPGKLYLWLMILFLSACQQQPWQDTTRCLESNDDYPILININGEDFCVDAVIENELCDAHLSGIVYVKQGLKVKEWDQHPDFMVGCDLKVDDGTIILVGDHDNAPYYNGCSCHTASNQIE